MRWLQKVLAWWRGDVSARWLREQRQQAREEFHGVPWRWPLVKK